MSGSMKLLLVFAAFLSAVTARAQLGHEIARQHAARAGDKLAALTALRAEGRTFINDEVVPFTLVAQRPNRLRVESFTPQRRVVQAYDGTNPPWISRTDLKGGAPQDMTGPDAREFMANADFDGPLVNFAEKGYSVDYAGEEPIEGRTACKLLVMNKSDSVSFLWVDAGNHEIVKRSVFRDSGGQHRVVETLFKDFREVGGVLQPHRIETSANGRLLYVMLIDRMEANPPEMPPETFARPPAPP
jgi:outer membrane lipoprotein-sorting protein